MPSIEELQRFQFQDFALENSKRVPLTVLGEHAYGTEQGRIVTSPVVGESAGGGGGGEVPPPEECGEGLFQRITIQAEMSGTLESGSECDPADAEFDISAVTGTETCEECVNSCDTEVVELVFTCPGECVAPDEPPFTFSARVNLALDEFDHWIASISIFVDGMFCGRVGFTDIGGEFIHDEDLGTSPAGSHLISFDDPEYPTVHYDITVVITL